MFTNLPFFLPAYLCFLFGRFGSVFSLCVFVEMILCFACRALFFIRRLLLPPRSADSSWEQNLSSLRVLLQRFASLSIEFGSSFLESFSLAPLQDLVTLSP